MLKKNCAIFPSLITFYYMSMNDNHILVIHSRWAYTFMGIILEAQVVFHFFAFMHSVQKLVSDFCDFQTLYVTRYRHRESITCKRVCESVRWIEAFIANLEHPLWGSQSMQDLASLMRKGRTFLIPDANSKTYDDIS